MENPFDLRRQNNPQGVIDDLLKQITRQCVGLRDAGVEVDRLKALLTEANIDFNKPLESKQRGRKKKIVIEVLEDNFQLEMEE